MSICWFRKGLRVHDNPALMAACKQDGPVYPVFCLDPYFVEHGRVGIRRWVFLYQTLVDLDTALRRLNSRLLVIRGKPDQVLPLLIKHLNIKRIYYETDTEPYAVTRDTQLRDLCLKLKVEFTGLLGHTLFDPYQVRQVNGGKLPLRYQSFLQVTSKLPKPAEPMDPPQRMHAVDQKMSDALVTAEPGLAGPNLDFSPPGLLELGVEDGEGELAKAVHPGGETEALKRFEAFMRQKKRVAEFEKPNTSPAAFRPASTTALSPYLKFGCLSPRLFYYRLLAIQKEIPKHSQPPTSLLGQLMWREFYYTVAACTPNYGQMKDNKICLRVDWHCANGPTDDKHPEAADHLNAWTEARTGFPWIDAIMTQLRTEGWIHHLARHSVACFLTRGDLYISWERGAEVFEELLLDADWSLNVGNWLWLSASAFFSQYFRVYSPIGFGQKYDKKGLFIRHYLPVLKDVPDKYIYEPWKAPIEVQRKAKCIIGQDYPHPIVNHDEARVRCMDGMKRAYARKQYG